MTTPAGNSQLQQINVNAAGIDVGATMHYVAVPGDRDPQPVRKFGTYTEDLHRLAQWLVQCKIETVALESTGVYWIALWEVLEVYGLEVVLVDARKVKNVSGRKSDQLDCQWLQTLHSYGLLAGCFRPEAEIRVLRSYLRQRQMLIEARSVQVQHMQKALVQMNIQLTQLLSDVTGTSGLRILRAMIAGERECSVLARMADYRLKATPGEIEKALEGDWRVEHLFALEQAVALWDVYQQKIAECDVRILQSLEALNPKAAADDLPPSTKSKRSSLDEEHLRRVLFMAAGVDLSQINGLGVRSVEALISEIGTDMSRFPSEKHFCAWLGLAPNPRISGAKVLRRRPGKVVNRAAQILRMAAYGLQRSDSALGAYLRTKSSQLGMPKAIKATAHRLAILVYRALRYGSQYVDIGQQAFERKMEERRIKALHRNAKNLGFVLLPATSAPTVS